MVMRSEWNLVAGLEELHNLDLSLAFTAFEQGEILNYHAISSVTLDLTFCRIKQRTIQIQSHLTTGRGYYGLSLARDNSMKTCSKCFGSLTTSDTLEMVLHVLK